VVGTSIVIPMLHNDSLPATLAAVAAEVGERADVEVIVAGLDRDGLHRALPSARFVSTEQQVYPGAARNAGAAVATGRRLVFVDADCLPLSGWLGALEAHLKREPCAVGGGVAFDDDGYWSRTDNVALFHEFLTIRPPGRRRYLASLNFAIDRDLFDRHGGFDPALRSAEDLDLTARLDRAGVPLYFEPSAVVRHRPSRRRALDVWRHHFTYGANSARVRRRHPGVLSAPFVLRSRALMALLGPAIAAITTARIFLVEPGTRRYWRTAPGVYLAKLAWCWSVAARGTAG
jgi:GT2 family glycosyltransferase